jgi:hypothetical protein
MDGLKGETKHAVLLRDLHLKSSRQFNMSNVGISSVETSSAFPKSTEERIGALRCRGDGASDCPWLTLQASSKMNDDLL